MTAVLTVAIVDDEPLVRQGLLTLIKEEPDLRLVAEAADGVEAIEILNAQRPDVVFLDIQMPAHDGFSVLSSLSWSPMPAVVFVTAFDQYAIKAFDVHAVDYLLKPFDADRFRTAIERVRARLAGRSGAGGVSDAEERVRAVLDAMGERRRYAERLMVKDDGRVHIVPVEEVIWVEAADNYVRLHTRGGSFLMREAISTLAERLDPRRFARSHRSSIVQLARVRELQPLFNGELAALLTTGERISVGRRYREDFEAKLRGEPLTRPRP